MVSYILINILEILKKFYEYNKFTDKSTRVTNRKNGDFKSNKSFKSLSVAKNNSNSTLSSIKVSQSQEGMQNNININVNNLIINNAGGPNGKNNNSNYLDALYPNNYGVYLANSSFFTKLGNNIINSPGTTQEKKEVGKRYLSQPKIQLKNQENTLDINNAKITVNNIYNNFETDQENMYIQNFNEAPRVLENIQEEDYTQLAHQNELESSIEGLGSPAYNSDNTFQKTNMINDIISNILDQNKNNINSTPTRYHIKNNKPYSSSVEANLKNKFSLDPIEEYKNLNVKVNRDAFDLYEYDSKNSKDNEIKINNSNQNQNADDNFISISDENLKRHESIWELIIELYNSNETKHYLSQVSNKLLKCLEDEIVTNGLILEIFSNTSLNKIYSKILKITSIILIFLKHISLDYNYESNMRSNVKKFIYSILEHFLILMENFVLVKDYQNKFSTEFLEKYNKCIKLHKIKKYTKETLIGNLSNGNLYKNLETAITSVKQFSNMFFKVGYFKPIHTVCFEIFRAIDNTNLTSIINLLTRNILYYIIHAESQIREKLSNPASKQSTMNSVMLGLNIGTSLNPPFIPEAEEDLYTLVLDLDETLVHYFFTPSGGTFLIRPGAHEFLQEMSKYYEIVIFTAAMKDYADNILDKLDCNKTMIKHRLYRHHTSITNMGVIKDLSKLGRNLSKVIIVDNIAENFRLQPNNGLYIKTWNEDMKDTQLYDFEKILRDIKILNVTDVRGVIKKIREEVLKKVKKNSPNPYANIEVSKLI